MRFIFLFRGQYLTDHLDGGHYIFNRGQYFIEKGDTFSKEKWPGALFCADHFTSLHRTQFNLKASITTTADDIHIFFISLFFRENKSGFT